MLKVLLITNQPTNPNARIVYRSTFTFFEQHLTASACVSVYIGVPSQFSDLSSWLCRIYCDVRRNPEGRSADEGSLVTH